MAVPEGPDQYYVHTDQLGTPRVITAGNTIVWRWQSDPFGSTAAQEDPDGDGTAFTYNLRFPGQYLDQETGQHYNYFRDYDPVVGQCKQSGPRGVLLDFSAPIREIDQIMGLATPLDGLLPKTTTTYTYAYASPATSLDPTGEFGPIGALGSALC